jgi:YVTN family beta-propeller protein
LIGAAVLAACCLPTLSIRAASSAHAAAPTAACLSPTALAATPDGRTLYVACATAGKVAVFDTASRKIKRTIAVPDEPLGLALAGDGKTLYVACAAPESTVCVVDTAKGKLTAKLPAGHTAMAPVLSPDGKKLFVCCRFNNCIDVIDLASKQRLQRINVPREPVAAAVTPDGKFLLVANHIHAGRSDVDVVAATVTVIDLAAGRVCKELELPNGSTLLRDVRISPDGRYAVVTHQIGRFHLPTTQLERGWVNTNALTLIDLTELKVINSVLLDNIDSGAANPWAAAWSADGKTICVTHTGTHELSVIDFPALLAKLAKLPAKIEPGMAIDYSAASRTTADVPNDLSFLVGLRQRIRLGESDRAPRALVLLGTKAWLANYFTDTLAVIDLAAPRPCAESIALGPKQPMTVVRKGEFLFNDATICFQGWQSCASCHSSDARVDGLNWDNLNDGIGNPKNVKSLLQAHYTPPSMWLAVRTNAFVGVRMGIKNSLFTVQPEESATAIDEYLKALKPIPSPYLVKGKLSAAAERGKKLFFDDATRCGDCHKGKYYTDLKLHKVGTVGKFDQPENRFDTPSLVELWRTAPYLHDGRAATLREVFTDFNEGDLHGKTSHLSPQQIDELVEFVLSL